MTLFGQNNLQETDATMGATSADVMGQPGQFPSLFSFSLPSRELQQPNDTEKNLGHPGVADKVETASKDQETPRTMHVCKRCKKVFSLPFPKPDPTRKVRSISTTKCGAFHSGK